jgi:ABC-2 type transport system permease protein
VTGLAPLVRLLLRRDRIRLPLWVFGVVGLVYVSGSAMGKTFPTQASLDSYAASVGTSAAAIALSGPPIALNTLGGVVINKIAFIALGGVCVMAVRQTVRHTRAEEETGRAELLRSTVLGRHTAAGAALLVVGATSALIGLGTALALVSVHVAPSGAWLFGAGTMLLGWVFAVITLCLCQVFAHARTALGTSLAVLGLAYVVRAVGDVKHSWLVWLSPIGWAQAAHVAGQQRWWPLLVSLVATGAGVAAAVALSNHRDLGGGLVASRPGPPRAARTLGSPVGLAWRLQRGMVLGWAAALFAFGLVLGSLATAMQSLAGGNQQLLQYLHATASQSLVDPYFATMLVILALLAAVSALTSALRPVSEESAGRAELVLATGLSRTRWFLGSLTVTLLGAVLALLAGGLGTGLGYAGAGGGASQLLRLVASPLAYAPAVLSAAALAAVLQGWLPRFAALAWAYLGLCVVLGWLGGLISPPAWVTHLSAFTYVPAVPAQELRATPLVVTAVLVVAAGCLAVVGLRRRDIA